MTDAEIEEKRRRLGLAIGIISFLWLVYTVVYTPALPDALSATLEIILGVLGLAVLIAVLGFTRKNAICV